ncbi:MAG: calcium-binding protein, partial [Selenomonadaceae bacterium]|nr:calcium-binding protein [Selenomonadaceae bacterium]
LKMSDIIQITSGSYTTTTRGDDLIIKVGSGQMTLKEAANRRLRVQNANGTIDTLNPNGIAYIYNNESDTLLIGSNLNDTINNLGSNVTINAGVGDDSIYNEGYDSKNISISGGAGNDTIMCRGDELTINGGTGDDTIRLFVPYSSANNSVIQYANGDGKDIIYSYNSTDTIEIAGSSYTTTTSGNDVIISVGSGKMTLKNAFDYTLNIVTVSGGTSTNTETNTETTTTKLPTGLKYNTNKTQITVSTKFKGDTVDLSEYATTVKTVKATSFNKTLKISGNDLGNKITVGKKATTVYGGEGNDTITGGKGADVLYGDEGNDKIKGGSGADTLVGGAGADTLTGGAGKDVFVYEDGNDIITDYKAGQDSIMIEDEIEAVSVKGSNVIFTIGDGSLTVKGGKNKKITFIDSEGEVISNDKYTKSTKVANFVESPPVAGAGRTPTAGDAGSDYDYWFAADENFTTAEIDAVDNLIKTKSPAINLTELNVDFTSINQNDKSQTTLAAYNKINNSYF